MVVTTAVIIGGILIAASQIIFMRGFRKVENRNTTDAVERATGMLSDRISNLDALNHDWPARDATYYFIQHPENSQSFIDSDAIDLIFISTRVNILLVLKLSGELIYDEAFDTANNVRTDLPAEIKDFSRI